VRLFKRLRDGTTQPVALAVRSRTSCDRWHPTTTSRPFSSYHRAWSRPRRFRDGQTCPGRPNVSGMAKPCPGRPNRVRDGQTVSGTAKPCPGRLHPCPGRVHSCPGRLYSCPGRLYSCPDWLFAVRDGALQGGGLFALRGALVRVQSQRLPTPSALTPQRRDAAAHWLASRPHPNRFAYALDTWAKTYGFMSRVAMCPHGGTRVARG
jgi:hypothetical protein